ncbi:MAG: HDIG domain-containing protein [Candidatus Brocadiia bacterium]
MKANSVEKKGATRRGNGQAGQAGARTGDGNGRETATGAPRGSFVWLALLAVAVFLTLNAGQEPLQLELGQAAPRDYRARVEFMSPDLARTERDRELARLKEPAVFTRRKDAWDEQMVRVLRYIRQADKQSLRKVLPQEARPEQFLQVLPQLSSRSARLEEALRALADRPVVSPQDLSDISQKLAERVAVVEPDGRQRLVPTEELVPLQAEAEQFAEALEPALDGLSDDQAQAARQALAVLLEPSVSLDMRATQRAAEAAAAQKPRRLRKVAEGTPILAEGAEVGRQDLEDVRSERDAYRVSRLGWIMRVQQMAGTAVVLGLLLLAASMYARLYQPELLNRRLQMLSFALLTLVVVSLARLCVMNAVTPLWVPVPLMVMMMCLVYDQRTGLAMAVFYAVLVRLAAPGANPEFIVLLVGGLMAALLTRNVRTRGALIKAGLLTGLIQALGVWGLGLAGARYGARVPLTFWRSPLLAQSLAALANGLLSGFIVSGALPLIERLFDVTTDIRLLEWSDPNQPLLQRLLLEAPGSYHHSMLVGSLAADAADAIGANPLLARVSAYFHDAGKLKKPEYFAENLPEGGPNPHDDLTPTMSSLIITAHPKDGAEMAEKYGVPREVRDIILQSHGSSVLKYFWGKVQEDEQRSTQQVQEHDFRYRLPKPASREAAIVMLCDAVESAARSMESPSPKQLRAIARQIIMDRLHDGQLDESGLTITDLKRLEDSLVRGVTAIFHNRIRYPGQEEVEEALEEREVAAAPAGSTGRKERKAHEGADLQPTEEP